MSKTLLAVACLAAFAALQTSAQAGCPPEYKERTPFQVVADLRAATGAQDWDLVACNYSRRAFVIDDQGILVGREDIVAAAQSLAMLFNGVSPTILQEDNYRDVVREIYRLDAGWVVIPDGVRTFHIRKGKIRRQTSHGLIEFTGPPPE